MAMAPVFPLIWRLYLALIILVLTTTPALARTSHVDLRANGYEGVVVAVSPLISEEEAKKINLLGAIKEAIEEGSEALFEATQKRVFFRQVEILIPNHWNTTQVDSRGKRNFKDSHIRIDTINPQYQEQPYTQQSTLECGAEGDFIHLTPEYLTQREQGERWGSRGKIIAAEWAKFRYGIFDEVGYPGDPVFPLFYKVNSIGGGTSTYSFKYQPNVCSDETVKGGVVDHQTNSHCATELDGSYNANCRFMPSSDNPNVKSSLLSYGHIRNDVTLFCNDHDHAHNRMAPTKQNFYCHRRSAWEVMMLHPDFHVNSNPTEGKSEPVQIKVVRQAAEANYVLVLDYSGSMGDTEIDEHNRRIDKLQRTCQSWIKNDLNDGTKLAIVRFSGYARTSVLAPLSVINNANRNSLAQLIHTNVAGGTCIGCGLEAAIKVIHGKKNCVIILMTDGEENQAPYMADVNTETVATGCRVVTIAFGPKAAEGLELLAKNTDGSSFSVNDKDITGTELNDAFEFSLQYQPDPDESKLPVKIIDSNIYKGPMTNYTEEFIVDQGLGLDLVLRLLTNDMNHIKIPPVLIGPDGKEHSATKKDDDKRMYVVHIEIADHGRWSWRVGLSGDPNNYIISTITCKAFDAKNEPPITLEGWTSAPITGVDLNKDRVIIFAKVKQGNSPVVGAEVMAIITLPDASNKEPIYLELKDSGSDPDVTEGDGIYSRYLTGIDTKGRINIKIKVTQGLNTVISRGTTYYNPDKLHVSGLKPDRCCGSVVTTDPDTAEPTGDFSRGEVIGSIKITGIPVKDTFPPAQVRDLSASDPEIDNTDQTKYQTTLIWTAPGDDLDIGKVSKYTLRFSKEETDLFDDKFAMAKEYDLSPETQASLLEPAGSHVVLTIPLEKPDFHENIPYFFAITSQDEQGNESPISNIVSVIIDKHVTTDPDVIDNTQCKECLVMQLPGPIKVNQEAIIQGNNVLEDLADIVKNLQQQQCETRDVLVQMHETMKESQSQYANMFKRFMSRTQKKR